MDACDELGLFIIVATPGWQYWNKDKGWDEKVHENTRNIIRRDRNHPCVLMWEPILNETRYPEESYRVWQNRMEGPQYGLWQNDYNDPIPGETFEYPEFKGYFANVSWMQLQTTEGKFGIELISGKVAVYTPRDGRDHILYTLPETGISILKTIPAVRNKVNTTDLNGPSAQPYWSKGKGSINAILRFE